MHSWRCTPTPPGTDALKFLLQEGHCCETALRKTPTHTHPAPNPGTAQLCPPSPFATLTPPCKPPTSRGHPARRSTRTPPLPPQIICSQTQGWGGTGGTRGQAVAAAQHPPPPLRLPLSTHSTAASTASRSVFIVRRWGHGDAQSGWLRARLAAGPGAGGGERPWAPPPGASPRPAPPPLTPPRPRLVSFTRCGEPGSEKGEGACQRFARLWSKEPRGSRGSSPLALSQRLFPSPFPSGPFYFPEGRDRNRRAPRMPEPTHAQPFSSATPCIHDSLHPRGSVVFMPPSHPPFIFIHRSPEHTQPLQ